MMTTQVCPTEQAESKVNKKAKLITARDVSSKAFLPFLAQFLQESNKVNYKKLLPKIGSSCNANQAYLTALEKWYCEIAASTLFQIYLHPCFQLSYPKARVGSQAANLAKAQRIAQATCLKELMEVGWIIKDRTGIILVSQEGIEKMDSIANQISQRDTKSL